MSSNAFFGEAFGHNKTFCNYLVTAKVSLDGCNGAVYMCDK